MCLFIKEYFTDKLKDKKNTNLNTLQDKILCIYVFFFFSLSLILLKFEISLL